MHVVDCEVSWPVVHYMHAVTYLLTRNILLRLLLEMMMMMKKKN